MMDAKKALEAADGDMEAAKQALREKGLAKADARSDRDNDEGTVAIAVDGNTAAVVQIKTETDFSAKNNAVTTLAQTLADAVLTGGPGAVDAHADAIDDLKVTIKENIELGAVEQIIAADGNILDTYLHSQDGRGERRRRRGQRRQPGGPPPGRSACRVRQAHVSVLRRDPR